MANRSIVDGRMLKSLSRAYPDLCDILEVRTDQRSPTGELIKNSPPLERHVDVPCAKVSDSRSSRRGELLRDNGTVVRNPVRLALRGHFPDVTEKMQAKVGTVTYDILHVEHDSQAASTYLDCELVK